MNARDGMWNLISAKEQSKIKMIEEFYKTNEPVTIDTLSQVANTSNRSVKNYLKELQEIMEELGAKFISSSEGVNFEIPINIGLDYFQKQLFKDSLGLALLEKIFFDETLTSEELANELFVSQSTLNRLTKSIREALKPFGLDLETTPYRVVGHEEFVRHFYTNYFFEAYRANEWPFEGLDQEVIREILPSAVDYYQSTSDVMNYTYFKIIFAVALERNLQGYPYQGRISSQEKFMPYYEKTVRHFEENTKHLSFDSAEERNSYIRELAIIQLSISRRFLQKRLEIDPVFKDQFEGVTRMIEFLSNYFELPAENQTNLTIEIDAAITFFSNNAKNLQPSSYLFYPPRDYYIVKLYQRKYSAFYETAKNYILLLCESRGFKPTEDTFRYIIYLLFSKWKDLTKHLFTRYNSTTILVYSHLSLRSAHNIAQSLDSDLPEPVEIKVLEETTLNGDILSKYSFDILITTQTLFLAIDQPIVYMYKSRSSYQYEYLQRLIREMATQKEIAARGKLIMDITSHELKEHLANLME